VAAGLVRVVLGDDLYREPETVCDPAAGGGVFLLAAARALRTRGAAPDVVVSGLFGADLDPSAVAATRAALALWAGLAGADLSAVAGLATQVRQGDGLLLDDSSWPTAPPAGFDLVVGNPPFLNQLERGTARVSRARAGPRSHWFRNGGLPTTRSNPAGGSVGLG